MAFVVSLSGRPNHFYHFVQINRTLFLPVPLIKWSSNPSLCSAVLRPTTSSAARLPTPFPSLMIRIREAGASTVGGSSCFHAHYNLTAPQSGNSWNTRFRGSQRARDPFRKISCGNKHSTSRGGAAAASHDRQMSGRAAAD